MVRVEVRLTEEQAAVLKRAARERGVSVSELVREGVDWMLNDADPRLAPDREERKRRALSIETFHSGVTDLSTRQGDYFVEAILDPNGG